MLALKDITGVRPTLGNTPLANSPLWETPVDRIVPAQLVAYRARLALEGKANQADAALDYLLHQVAEAVRDGELDAVALLDYSGPPTRAMTSTELARGFARMTRPMPAAALFGLETGLSPDEVVTLTWKRARRLKAAKQLSPLASHVLNSQPIHIATDYVFWRHRGNKVLPVFGLEQELFDIFGMVWGEFRQAYRQLVLIDPLIDDR